MLNTTTYEALPFAYIGAGLLNAALLDSPMKFLPVILLIGAGIMVLIWRRSARTRVHHQKTTRNMHGRQREHAVVSPQRLRH